MMDGGAHPPDTPGRRRSAGEGRPGRPGRRDASVHLGRRHLLGALGGAALGTGVVGTVEAAQYGTVVNLVDEGADNTGGESVTPVLEAARDQYGDDTLYRFPDGEYAMDAQFRWLDCSHVGFHGSGATIVPASYRDFDGPQYRLFRLGTDYAPARDLEFKGFTVDQTARNTGIRVIETWVTDGLEVADIDVVGYHDSGTWGPAYFAVTDRDGHGTVTDFRAADGGERSEHTPGDLARGPTGILLSTDHRGTIEFRNCVLGGFPDNGLYASTYGTVRVVGGRYANSDTASIRLRGYDCAVIGATVVVDRNPAGFRTQRGIRLDAGSRFLLDGVDVSLSAPNGPAVTLRDKIGRARIEDTEIHVGDRTNHAIEIQGGAGPTAVVNTDVSLAGGGNALHIEAGDEPVVGEYLQIWGMASGATFRHAIRCNRDGCEFRRVKIWQPGPDQRRAIVFNGDDCLLYRSECVTRHHPVLVNGSGAWLSYNTLRSYDEWEAVKLNDTSSDVTIKRNKLYGGVLDEGSSGLRLYGNDVV